MHVDFLFALFHHAPPALFLRRLYELHQKAPCPIASSWLWTMAILVEGRREGSEAGAFTAPSSFYPLCVHWRLGITALSRWAVKPPWVAVALMISLHLPTPCTSPYQLPSNYLIWAPHPFPAKTLTDAITECKWKNLKIATALTEPFCFHIP